MGHFPNPLTHKGPHFVWNPCSDALLGRFTTACVSSPRDWAVSVGSHMQQDMECERLHMQEGRSLCWKPLASLTSFEKLAIDSFT